MAIHGVNADSDYHPIKGFYGFMNIPEATRFNASPFCKISEIEVKNHVFEAGPLRQSEGRAIIEITGEIWGN